MSTPRRASPVPRPGFAWIGLVTLTLASLAVITGFPARGWAACVVAAIAWIKGDLIARHFMEVHDAGPIFTRIVRVFVALAPLGLVATAANEFGPWR